MQAICDNHAAPDPIPAAKMSAGALAGARYRMPTLPSALKSRLKRLFALAPQDTVSVIVPIYNVAPYLAECLDSVVAQSHRHLDIVLVDDGSTDESAAIARAYVERDPRIRLVAQPNRGLGAARNTGIRHARGQFLCFVDSDDLIPPAAIAAELAALQKSGSQFCVGVMHRLEHGEIIVRRWMREMKRRDRFGITIDDEPQLLRDVFAASKLFRRDFWQREIGFFPEGVRYEDQEPTARAYMSKCRFDVISDHVYTWRIRDDGTSITQRKYDIADLADRIAVVGRLHDLFRETDDPRMLGEWFVKIFSSDLPIYCRVAAVQGDDYWGLFQPFVRDLIAACPAEAWLRVDIFNRLLALAAGEGAREALRRLIASSQRYGRAMPTRLENGHVRFDDRQSRFFDRELLADDIRLGPQDLRLVAALTQVEWTGDGGLALQGYAYVTGVEPQHYRHVRMQLRQQRSGRVLDVPLAPQEDERIDELAGDAWHSYAGSGFRTVIDGEALNGLLGSGEGVAEIRLVVEAEDAGWSGPVSRRGAIGDSRISPYTPIRADGSRDSIEFSAVDGVLIRRSFPRHAVADIAQVDNTFILTMRDTGSAPVAKLNLTSTSGGRSIAASFDEQSGAYLLDPDVPDEPPHAPQRWILEAEDDTGRSKVAWHGTAEELERRSLPGGDWLWLTGPLGNLSLQWRPAEAEEITPPERPKPTRSRFAQRLLYVRAADLPDAPKRMIVLESAGGSEVTGDPAALLPHLRQALPDWLLYWSVRDPSTAVPDGVKPLVHDTPDWLEGLHRARLVVSDGPLHHAFRKKKSQFYLQCWAGTPLARIGLQLPPAAQDVAAIDQLQKEAGFWDLLLAQSGDAEAVLRRSTFYRGEALVEGLPRNDPLTPEVTGTRRDEARRRLGLAPDAIAVLLATEAESVRGYDLGRLVDFPAIRACLPPNVVFLVRQSADFTLAAGPLDMPGVVDVTCMPAVQDIMIASDLLVTDQAATIFDYCITGKPIVFYRPLPTGISPRPIALNFDLSEIAPGPTVHTPEALGKAIVDAGAHRVRHAERYARFVSRFAPKDDGRAGERITRRVLELLPA